MRVGAVNLASFANVLCHLNTTPLSVAVLAPCAWGESVAWQGAFLGRSGAWQGVVNLATHNTAWRGEFGNETAQQNKIQWHGNKIQHNEFIKATIANGTHSTTNSIKYGEFGNANNARQIRLGKRGENGQCLQAKQTKRKCGSVWAGDFSLSLSLSLLALLARLWAKFKRLFCSFHHIFISFYCKFHLFHRNFVLSCHKFFLFHRGFISYFCSCFSFYHSFNSSFHSQKAFFRAFCFFEIFKRFVFGFFVFVIASRFCENGVAIHKFSVIFTFWIATLALLARNDGGFCHFEPL